MQRPTSPPPRRAADKLPVTLSYYKHHRITAFARPMPGRTVLGIFIRRQNTPHSIHFGKEDDTPMRKHTGDSFNDGALTPSITTALSTARDCNSQLDFGKAQSLVLSASLGHVTELLGVAIASPLSPYPIGPGRIASPLCANQDIFSIQLLLHRQSITPTRATTTLLPQGLCRSKKAISAKVSTCSSPCGPWTPMMNTLV